MDRVYGVALRREAESGTASHHIAHGGPNFSYYLICFFFPSFFFHFVLSVSIARNQIEMGLFRTVWAKV